MRKQDEYILQSVAIATAILLISFVASVLPAYASEFPSDAKTQMWNFTANGTFLLMATSTRTILNTQVKTDPTKGIESTMWCGNTLTTTNIIQDTMNINYQMTPMSFRCINSPVYYSVAGFAGLGGDYTVSWVERDTSTTRDPMELGQSVATSTFVNGSFSATTTATIANSSSSPFFTQDAGNLSFLLTILISLMFLMVVGFVYNNMTNKKPWH